MTDQQAGEPPLRQGSEGQAAIEAARKAVSVEVWVLNDGCAERCAKAAIRAYLAALPGWRLIPEGMVRDTRWHLAPPPPGLDSEDGKI